MKKIFSILTALLLILTMFSEIEVSASTATSTKLVSDAKSYIGTPYKWGGVTPTGFDCSGYILYVFNKSGIQLPRTTREQYKEGTAVSKSNLKAGDLVFFNTTGSGVSHAGIYIGNNNFIHTSSSKGVMISSINDPYYWGSKYVGAKRVFNFTNQVIQTSAKTPSADVYVSRIEVIETLAVSLGLQAKSKDTYFSDVYSTHPKIQYINAVYEAGIFTGSNGKLNPNGKLTRAQLAKILVEAYNLKGQKDPNFKDVYDGFWAQNYIETLYYNNITTGYANGYYGVNDKVTHMQFGKFIDRSNK
ncbi:C40 family peptidase [Planococcus glaciei]|uniref:C40 family peptidase n=1 Tax=Planococcus glaciei TaxID=459472 RepID=UPI001C72EF3C|nr:C40 family peptidase [Planococcus glaciei]MBX0316847.1 C40 family peptidase [Planococcus glaciei]